jgi:hypothetical protein
MGPLCRPPIRLSRGPYRDFATAVLEKRFASLKLDRSGDQAGPSLRRTRLNRRKLALVSPYEPR